jgi:hypothetical protein
MSVGSGPLQANDGPLQAAADLTSADIAPRPADSDLISIDIALLPAGIATM